MVLDLHNKLAYVQNGSVTVDTIGAASMDFIEENFGNFNKDYIKFGWDPASEYYYSLNLRDAFPATLIIDENGVIQYKIIGSVHYDDDREKLGLKSMVENVLNNGN